METKLEGPFARLPDGQLVKIAAFHLDGFASVQRVEGEMTGESLRTTIRLLTESILSDPQSSTHPQLPKN